MKRANTCLKPDTISMNCSDWLDRQRRLVRRDLESRPRLLLRSHLAINIRSVNYASRRHSMACRCAASRHPRLASFWFLALASCKFNRGRVTPVTPGTADPARLTYLWRQLKPNRSLLETGDPRCHFLENHFVRLPAPFFPRAWRLPRPHCWRATPSP